MNLHGYKDYNGPGELVPHNPFAADEGHEETWTVGTWMEGDSLAPPCGTSVSVAHSIIDMAFQYRKEHSIKAMHEPDVLYDLGCGDGRICFEAYWKYCLHGDIHNLVCVGVEIEEDLIQRFKDLIALLASKPETSHKDPANHIIPVQGDLCEVLKSLHVQYQSGNDTDMVLEDKPPLLYSHLRKPTIITLYLLPDAIHLIEPILLNLLHEISHLIIVCNTWGFQSREASRILYALDSETGLETKLYLYASHTCIK